MVNLTLNPKERLDISNASIVLEYALVGCAAQVEARTATRAPSGNAKHSQAQKRLIMPQVPEDTTFSLTSLNAEPFPEGAYAFITLIQNNVGGTTEVRLPKIELGGVYSQQVLTITPSGNTLTLALPSENEESGKLSSLAKNARQAAINKLGVNRVPNPVATLVALDDSASMRVHTAEISDVLHVLEGIIAIVGENQPIAFAVVGDSTDLRINADLTEGFDELPPNRPAHTGANLADGSIFRFMDSYQPAAVVIITDGVPSTIRQIERAAQERVLVNPNSSVSLVLLMDGDAARFEPATSLPITTMPRDLDRNKNALPQMVGSLLDGVKL